MGARWYVGYINRWIQPDPIIPDLFDPQSLNRYAYVLGNPLRLVDPSGNTPVPPYYHWGRAIMEAYRGMAPGVCPGHECQKYARYERTIGYIHREMVSNASSGITQILRELRGVGTFRYGGVDADLATAVFGGLVASRSVWDHKPILARALNLSDGPEGDYFFPIEGDPGHEYYYDIWSNIHYGYVGSAAGFDAETLQVGPATAEGAGTNDAFDILSIRIGIDLWFRYGLDLTLEQLRDAILAHRGDYIRIWEELNNTTAHKVVLDCRVDESNCR
jgi:hypothetical protein